MNWNLINIIVGKSIKNCYVHSVRLEMVFNKLDLQDMKRNLDHYNSDADEDDKIGIENGMTPHDLIDSLTWNTQIWNSNITKLTVFNQSNGNDDKRGGGCGSLD